MCAGAPWFLAGIAPPASGAHECYEPKPRCQRLVVRVWAPQRAGPPKKQAAVEKTLPPVHTLSTQPTTTTPLTRAWSAPGLPPSVSRYRIRCTPSGTGAQEAPLDDAMGIGLCSRSPPPAHTVVVGGDLGGGGGARRPAGKRGEGGRNNVVNRVCCRLSHNSIPLI